MTKKLDVTGHECPVPVLRVRRELERMDAGAILRVEASDPMTRIDMPHFCQENGHNLVEMSVQNGLIIFLIEKHINDE